MAPYHEPSMVNDGSEWPLVTVVTPSFNQGRFIRETIESVLSQDYPRVEYVVMDGGSTDETVSILESYGDRLTWVSAPDGGQTSAINTAWRRARGTILAYLNSDDTYRPGAIETAVAGLRENPEAARCTARATTSTKPGGHRPIPDRALRHGAPGRDLLHLPADRVPPPRGRRAARYLDESRRYCMDYDLWIRLARVSRFVYLPRYWPIPRACRDQDRRASPAGARGDLDPVHHHFGH